MTKPFDTVTAPADLTELWTTLTRRERFAGRTLWVVFLDDENRLEPLVMPIDEIPPRPEPGLLEPFTELLCTTLDEQRLASTAFAVSRPGGDTMTADDRAWARALTSLPDARLRHWPVHLATRGQVRVFAPDDLLGAA